MPSQVRIGFLHVNTLKLKFGHLLSS
uniref:Uncharacterized protein n=1 Tax=Rhizophora mucronata TaxID=61149 RepID=A0A2P2LA59_RHIMU